MQSTLTDSDGLRSTGTEENVDLDNDLVLSQENKPQTHRTVREIAIISRDVMSLVAAFYWNTA